MRKRGSQHHIDGLLALLLFGVFAVCVLAVLLTGARAYRGLTQRDQAAYSRRVCVQYIATRVRQADGLDRVKVEPFGESQALVLSEDGYATRVYCYEGYLMELYASVEEVLQPEDGQRIIPMGGMELALEDGMLSMDITDGQGVKDSLRLSLRSGEGAAA
ncbi:DUF4860 domain-containing protein [bacterium 1xD42-67]|nr:DUF4860 domain-containing protein [bacterium 1xD42-67]